MLMLGIETATDRVGAALVDQRGVLAEFHANGGRRHAETLTPAIEFLLAQTGHDAADLAAIAVDVGPGLFTGLRVGMATAKAMAHALTIPTVGLPSLDLVAFPLRYAERRIVAALDARRGELYWATYWPVPGGVQREGEFRLTKPEELASELLAEPADTLVVGDGAHRYADALGSVGGVELADPALSHPSSSSLVQLAHARAMREEFVNQSELEPIYLRRPDAEINWRTRHD
jgi:tRNA threonylcarbamoyladenosine biosynthesis protein TsaB